MTKRLLTFLLSGTIAFSSLTASYSTSYAAESIIVTNKIIQQLPMPQESDYANLKERSLGTKVVKEAIEFILKHADEAAEVVENVAGKTVAKNFKKYFGKICNAIEPLLSWTELPAQAVYDAVYRTLKNVGASNTVATNVALAIKEGLSWFI